MSHELARQLLDKADRAIASAALLRHDGDMDAAISRSYYAMLYAAQAALLVRGFSYSSHRGVLSGFAQHLVRPGLIDREQHRWLSETFDRRLLSDYEVVETSQAVAEDVGEKAARFVATIRELFAIE